MCPGHAARAGRRAPRAAPRRAGRRAGRGAGARTCTVELESRSKWFGDRIRKSNRVSKSKIEIYVEISLKRQEKQHLPHTRCHKKKQLETRQLADTHTHAGHTHTHETHCHKPRGTKPRHPIAQTELDSGIFGFSGSPGDEGGVDLLAPKSALPIFRKEPPMPFIRSPVAFPRSTGERGAAALSPPAASSTPKLLAGGSSAAVTMPSVLASHSRAALIWRDFDSGP